MTDVFGDFLHIKTEPLHRHSELFLKVDGQLRAHEAEHPISLEAIREVLARAGTFGKTADSSPDADEQS